MVISESGLCAAMRAAFQKKSTGYKIAATVEDGERKLVLAAPGWTAVVSRDKAPRKVLALIVEHMGDLPKEGEAFQIQDKKAQVTIFDMAVPEAQDLRATAEVKRTPLTYNGYQIWQRIDNHNVYMVNQKLEGLLILGRTVIMAEDGALCADGCASRLYIHPLQVMQDMHPVLRHLAKLQWV